MEFNLNNGIPVVRLRVFRAIDDPYSCNLFVKGHEHVLKSIGITKVTSSKDEWIRNPAVFVIIVESLDKKKVYGGVRIHVSGGSEPLPIEQAIGPLDFKIYNLVYDYSQQGAGEGCGLWNSREISGYGIGSIFLTRAGIAISSQIGIKSLFSLCAPYTVKLAQSVGYEIETRLGNNGTFYYPKLDLVATSMILKDINNLTINNCENIESINSLRENLNVVRIEELRSKKIEIHYSLEIPYLKNWSLIDTILNTKKLH